MRSWKKPTPEWVDGAVALLVHAEQYRYFFDRLENPEWVELLWKRGFFRHPLQPMRNEKEGTIRFPPWPEARYLARMARYKPELVAEIIKEMDDTDNSAVLDDLMDALLAMPPEVSAGLVEEAKRWAECRYLMQPEKMGELIAIWAKSGRTGEALRVARALLEVLPGSHHPVQDTNGLHDLAPEPQARFHVWYYQKVLDDHYPELVWKAGLPAFELLCDLLDEAIRLSREEGQRGADDYSYIWRQAIEDHLQDQTYTIKESLVSAVRDAAELAVKAGEVTLEEIVNALERRRWKIYRRIALHIIRVFLDQAQTLAAERLTDRCLFDDEHLRHEYVLLLRKYFPRLSGEDQAMILGWIEAGPDDVAEWKGWRRMQSGYDPSDEDVARYRAIWQRDWLARIGPHNLPEKWEKQYRNLCERYGHPDHPEFPVYFESSVGPTSPRTADELSTMSLSELLEFLRTWRSPEEPFAEPSPEGLARVLSVVVAQDPQRFAPQANQFRSFDPTYVRGVLFGLRDALRQGKRFDWKSVLELCEWVVSQPRDIADMQSRETLASLGWGRTRKVITDLLSAGFGDHEMNIPFSFRQRVWTILKPLTDDPDPTPEYEQRYGGSNMDPATLSINTTRGEAMHAVIRYALWVRRHLKEEPDCEERLQRGFEEMPEVREVLEAHLDLAREPSLAIRAIYGQWFPWLVLLDSEWARGYAAMIFPREAENTTFFEAAWNTYITFCKPYDKVLDILLSQYELAVGRIGSRPDIRRWLADPDEKLAEHLMAFYWRGKLSLDDSLLGPFWEKASDALRGHALAFIGQVLKQTGGYIPAETLGRLKQLWECRLAVAREAQHSSGFEKEMAAFGGWFASEKFDTSWALEQLMAALQLSPRTEPAHMVLEYLAKTVETEPLKSVLCLKYIAEGDQKGWEIYGSHDYVRGILQRALRTPDARQEAERVIHYLGSRGFLDFRDLLKG